MLRPRVPTILDHVFPVAQALLEVVHDLFEEQTSVESVVSKIMQRAATLLRCDRCIVLLRDREALGEVRGGARRGEVRQGRAGQGRAGQGRAGQGRAGQGRAGQGRAGHVEWNRFGVQDLVKFVQ